MDIKSITIEKPDNVNVILGQTHFIKTVEDMYEAIVSAAPNMKFGLAFSEASGACKVRLEGNDEELRKLAAKNVMTLGCGHCFLVMLKDGFPINILNAIKNLSEVCTIYAATANPLDVLVAQNKGGGGILGVIDGVAPKGVENEEDIKWRKDLLVKLGYKR